MDNNSNTQQPKLIRHEAVYSLVLGIISIMLPWLLIYYTINFIPGSTLLLTIIVATISAILGLFFGKKALSHLKRH